MKINDKQPTALVKALHGNIGRCGEIFIPKRSQIIKTKRKNAKKGSSGKSNKVKLSNRATGRWG